MKATNELFCENFSIEGSNRDKYKALVNDFELTKDITGRIKGLRRNGFKEFRESGDIWGSDGAGRLFDHVRLYTGKFPWISYAVSQPYLDVDDIINNFCKNPMFVSHCLQHGYRINVYENHKYNWWCDAANVIVFKYDEKNVVLSDKGWMCPEYLTVDVYRHDKTGTEVHETVKIGLSVVSNDNR